MLALDHGRVRCGCAVSDSSGTLVTPLAAVERPDSPDGLNSLAALVAEYEPQEVLVGLPLLESGEEGAQAAAARAFAGRLRVAIEPPVKLYDERFTTRQARESIAHGASSNVDSLAAAHLLEAYLEAHRGGVTGDERQ